MKNQLFIQSKEHFLHGIKGTIRRNQDSHMIHTNLDTDCVITSDGMLPSDCNNGIPLELFQIMERLSLGKRRLFLQMKDQTIIGQMKPLHGWVVVKEDPNIDKEDDFKISRIEKMLTIDGKF